MPNSYLQSIKDTLNALLGQKKETDAANLLAQDHKNIEMLFRDFEKADESDKKELAGKIILETALHTPAAREVIYPLLKEEGKATEVNKAVVMQNLINVLLTELEDSESSDETYEVKMSVLKSLVKDHFGSEESEMFSRLRHLERKSGESREDELDNNVSEASSNQDVEESNFADDDDREEEQESKSNVIDLHTKSYIESDFEKENENDEEAEQENEGPQIHTTNLAARFIKRKEELLAVIEKRHRITASRTSDASKESSTHRKSAAKARSGRAVSKKSSSEAKRSHAKTTTKRAKSKTAAKTKSKPVAKTKSKPAAKAKTKPTAKTKSKPTTKSKSKSIAKAKSKPAAKPAKAKAPSAKPKAKTKVKAASKPKAAAKAKRGK